MAFTEMESNRRISFYLLIGAIISSLAVLLQLYLIILNRTVSIPETTVRFFSYFTILTNIIVAIYFTTVALSPDSNWGKFFSKPGTVTAVTTYITLVGLSYQFLLRHIWEPKGWSMVADELLHSVIPLYALLYWIFAVAKQDLKWKMILTWTIYPVVYFILILIRGDLSGWYPYYFIDAGRIGYYQTFLNSATLSIAYLILSSLFMLFSKMGRGNKFMKG